MSTRLATQRQFIISTSSAAAAAVEAAAVEAAKSIQLETDEEQQELELVSKSTEDVLTVVERRTPVSPGSHGEEFEFCTEDGVVVAATLEDVMTQVAHTLSHTLFLFYFNWVSPCRIVSSCRRS